MKIIKFIAVLVFVFLTSCVGKSSESMTANSTSNNAAPVAQSFEKGVVTSNSNSAKSNTAGSGTGKGNGGGGGNERKSTDAQTQVVDQSLSNQPQPAVTERKIIRNADLSLETASPEEAQQQITTIAESKGGFVVDSTQSSSNVKATTRDTVAMTVRVPAEKFNESLDEIRRTASRVIVETVKGEDVTEEFIDIEARLKAKKSLEAQFIEIMKRANSVEDALKVQTELAEVRGEIEKIEGRKRFLENQASLSTVKIRLQTPMAFSANSDGFFYRLKESVGNGFDAAMNFVLGFVAVLIAILPFLILVVLPVFLIARYFWKKQRKQKSANEIAREEIKEE